MTRIDDESLASLRNVATKGLLGFLWLHIPFNLGVALLNGGDWLVPALIGTVLAGATTLSWRSSGSALATRLLGAVALIGMVSLLLSEMAGHRWQPDIHMYFFVALAALAVFCDPRVLFIAAASIALHHLVLNFLLPAAIYPGGADFGRVVLHAAIVAMETAVLVWLSHQLILLFRRSAEKEATIQLARAEARKREAVAAQQDKLAALGQLVGGVAHEINNLLQPALTFPGTVMDRLPAEDVDSREELEMTLESVRKVREIVKSILLFARKEEPTLEIVDLASEVERALLFVRDLLPPGVTLNPQIGATGVSAAINRTQLVQVLTNLVVNASHAIGGRGAIDITLAERRTSADEGMTLELEPGAAYLTLQVSDNGAGMDAETMAHIFEPFFTTKPQGIGTGLGLSVVYGILRSWQGAIAVDSILGRGSKFTLYMPVIGRAEACPAG